MENMKKIMPRFNWTIVQEINNSIGAVLVPTNETTGASLRKTINDVALAMSE